MFEQNILQTPPEVNAKLREEARAVVRRAVHAGDEDVVLFVGSGATAAINKLVGLIGLRVDEPLDRQYGWLRQVPPAERPVVLVGPYEHHSNELPWLETVAEVIEIGAGGGSIRFDKPEAGTKPLARGTLFPVAHTEAIIKAGLAGKRFIELPLFDGTSAEGAQDSSVAIATATATPRTPSLALALTPASVALVPLLLDAITAAAPPRTLPRGAGLGLAILVDFRAIAAAPSRPPPTSRLPNAR